MSSQVRVREKNPKKKKNQPTPPTMTVPPWFIDLAFGGGVN